MKFLWVIFISFFFYCEYLYAFSINKVVVNCGTSERCEDSKQKFDSMIRQYRNYDSFKTILSELVNTESIQEVYFQYKDETLYLDYKLRHLIRNITFNIDSTYEFEDFANIVTLSTGKIFNINDVNKSINLLKERLSNLGFKKSSIKYTLESTDDQMDLTFYIEANEPTLLKELKIVTNNQEVKKKFKKRLNYFLHVPWNKSQFLNELRKIEDELKLAGQLFSKVNLISENYIKGNNSLKIVTQIFVGSKFAFSYRGNKLFIKQELSKIINEELLKLRKKIDAKLIKKIIKEAYRKKGYYLVKVDSFERTYIDIIKNNVQSFHFEINEGKKLKVEEINFEGNYNLENDTLLDLFYEKATPLASRNYFDKEYFLNFNNILKSQYWEEGFVFVRLKEPEIIYDFKNNLAKVNYKISEGIRSKVRSITFGSIDSAIAERITSSIMNKVGKPFNSISLKDDLLTIQKIIKDFGFYRGFIRNLNGPNLVTYSKSYKEVILHFDIDFGEKYFFDGVVVIGNNKTKTKVIRREVDLKHGDILTPKKLEDLKKSLSKLGLFSQLKIVPLLDNSKDGYVNILIRVKEKEFGVFEIAPGFRTDLGYKLSTGLRYSNLFGTNKALSFNGQLNRRVSFSGFDSRRQNERKNRLEFKTNVSFIEPYIFNIPLSFQTEIGQSLRRYFSFDARIFKLNFLFSKSWTDAFSTGLLYQFESIKQFDATDKDKDEGSFEIGSVTPSMVYDLRDNSTNPTRGGIFSISSEFANPYLLSQEADDLVIDYYKLVIRNRFYFPMGTLGVWAMSVSWGQQKNLATETHLFNGEITRKGRIPSTKLFRLTGVDLVRGYADDEINRLDSGLDISQETVDNVAYFTNIKVEPRFFVDDNTMWSVFFDAGGLSLHKYRPLKLRTSIGLSFRYVTPVGSLNFSYGFKLRRKRLPETGDLESPGRFHVSIGFF